MKAVIDQKVAGLIRTLPPENFHLLHFTCRFLHTVSLHQDKNKVPHSPPFDPSAF